MKETLISFETANLAEEKCYPFEYTNIKEKLVPINIPTQNLLQKWLREVHNIHIKIGYDTKYYFHISNKDYHNQEVYYETYEEALEIGLQEALKLI